MLGKSDQARIEFVQCLSPDGLHKMVYKEWGEKENPNVLVCVHGLTRVSDDFDVLAKIMSKEFRVVCPDVVGRGRSDWLRSFKNYAVPQYVADMVTLFAKINVENISFLGTSMGGMIGMGLASMAGTPINRLVLNDIGPNLNATALNRIREYVIQPIRYNTFEEAAAYIRSVSQTFGEHTEEEWHKFCQDVLKQDQDGMWIRHYDLNLGLAMQNMDPELASHVQTMMWAAYDSIKCPTLLLRGANSDLLTEETATEMTRRGPKATLVQFADVGHAPALVHYDQIGPIEEFLTAKNG